MPDKTNKIVLITGCSTGFGRRLVPAFLEAGWMVIATLRNAEERQNIFAEERLQYAQCLHLYSLDVTKSEDHKAVAQLLAEQFQGQLDCLVNNAGYGLFGALEDMSEAQIRAEMEVNFFGTVLLTRALLPFLRTSQGRVINLSSLLGFSGMPLGSLYCASKFAIEGFSESLAHELAPHKVQVAIVEPGGFRTNFSDNHLWGEQSLNKNSPYFKQTQAYSKFRERQATGEGNSPDSVVKAVVALAQAKKMPLRVRCGKDAKSLYITKRLLPEWLFSRVMAKAYQKLFGGEN